MQALYIALCLCVLGTSALQCCETKGPCGKEMSQRGLTCDSNEQQRDECDHHDHFSGQDVSKLSDEAVKKACCQVTCYSMFSNNTFTCPAGYASPDEDNRHSTTADKSSNDLQKECCKVSCYTLFKANKFTCSSNHTKPNPKYLNDFTNEDMTSKTSLELQDRCCNKKSVCYSKLTAKDLSCDGFGRMPGQSMLWFSIAPSEPCERPALTHFLIPILHNQNNRAYAPHRHRRYKLGQPIDARSRHR